jgi:ornithine carbamoyltransferase
MFDIIEFRGFAHETAETLARWSGVPVINGLTDRYHPTQALGDIMTIREVAGTLDGITSVFLGDGRNNVSRSLAIVAAAMGMHHTIISPRDLQPDTAFLDRIRSVFPAGSITVTDDTRSVPRDAAVIYTDVWTSMGEEEKESERVAALTPYRVTETTMEAAPDAVFMHCLPAVRENEMTTAVIDGSRSVVWQQAENRKHTIKAVMLATLGLA